MAGPEGRVDPRRSPFEELVRIWRWQPFCCKYGAKKKISLRGQRWVKTMRPQMDEDGEATDRLDMMMMKGRGELPGHVTSSITWCRRRIERKVEKSSNMKETRDYQRKAIELILSVIVLSSIFIKSWHKQITKVINRNATVETPNMCKKSVYIPDELSQ